MVNTFKERLTRLRHGGKSCHDGHNHVTTDTNKGWQAQSRHDVHNQLMADTITPQQTQSRDGRHNHVTTDTIN